MCQAHTIVEVNDMMGTLMMASLMAMGMTVAVAQEQVRLAINFVPGGTATRIVTGKLKGEWQGPTPKSPDKPLTVPFDLTARVSFYIVVSQITEEGDGIVSVQPQGTQVKGTVGEQPLEFVIGYDGDVKASWGAWSFDSTKLPEEQRKKMRQVLTAGYEITVSPQGKVKAVKLSEALQGAVPPADISLVNQILSATLQALLPAPFPEEPVPVGKSWQFALPLPLFETEKPVELPFKCTLAELRGNEAVIAVQSEAKGDADLTLKRRSEKEPKITVKSGQLQAKGEVIFLLNVGVPQRATWKLSGEAKGIVTPPAKDASPVAFNLHFAAELEDQLLF